MKYESNSLTITPISEGTFIYRFGFELESYSNITSNELSLTVIVKNPKINHVPYFLNGEPLL